MNTTKAQLEISIILVPFEANYIQEILLFYIMTRNDKKMFYYIE